jgi:hypothetical protein
MNWVKVSLATLLLGELVLKHTDISQASFFQTLGPQIIHPFIITDLGWISMDSL